MLVSSSSRSATTQKYSTTRSFSLSYPPIPELPGSNAYIDSIATYDGSVLGSVQILPADISGRALSLAIPKGAMTAAQRAAVEAARMRAQAFGVNLTITEF